jgi:hypothetical protein
MLRKSSLLVCWLTKGEEKLRVAHNGQMWLNSSSEDSTSRVGVLKNTLCKFGGSEVAAPPSNYPCVVLVNTTRGDLNYWLFKRIYKMRTNI